MIITILNFSADGFAVTVFRVSAEVEVVLFPIFYQVLSQVSLPFGMPSHDCFSRSELKLRLPLFCFEASSTLHRRTCDW